MSGDFRTDFERYSDIENSIILYASLDEQHARRKSVIRNIRGRISVAFVHCIDGRNWSEDETESVLSEEMRDRRRKEMNNGRDWLNRGAIACAATHRSNLIGNISSAGKFLCEDDAVLSDEVIDIIANGSLQEELEQLDGVTLLDYRSRGDIIADTVPVAQVGRHAIHRAVASGIGSAACYFVPASIAPRIVAFQTPVSAPVDHWDEMIEAGVFGSLYLISPRAARIGDFPTDKTHNHVQIWKIQ